MSYLTQFFLFLALMSYLMLFKLVDNLLKSLLDQLVDCCHVSLLTSILSRLLIVLIDTSSELHLLQDVTVGTG